MKKKVKGLIGFSLVSILVLIGMLLFNNYSGAAAASITVGYVDMEKLQNELPDFKNLQQIIQDKESEFNLFRGYLYQEHQSAIKDLEKKITQEKNRKSAEEQANLDKKQQSEIKKMTEALNNRLSGKVAEIQGYLKEQEQGVREKVQNLIKTVAEEKNVYVVLDKKAVYHGGKDLTKDIIDMVRKQTEQDNKKSKTESKESKSADK